MLHILSAVVAFGPLFAFPTLHRAGRGADLARLHLYVVLPALVLTWMFGLGLVGMSDEVIEMSDAWILFALIVWLAVLAVGVFLVRPAITDEATSARARLSAGVGVTHLGLVVLLYLMTFKPGT